MSDNLEVAKECGAVKALEEAAAIFDGMEYGYEVTEHGMDFPEDILRREILRISATSKKAG